MSTRALFVFIAAFVAFAIGQGKHSLVRAEIGRYEAIYASMEVLCKCAIPEKDPDQKLYIACNYQKLTFGQYCDAKGTNALLDECEQKVRTHTDECGRLPDCRSKTCIDKGIQLGVFPQSFKDLKRR